jgi:uncharacterized protein
MCVGCRGRDDRSRLLRVVLEPDDMEPDDPFMVLVPDPSRRLPGRGASLHLAPGCLDLAERRRAFARALRVQGPVDTTAVRRYVEAYLEEQRQ